MTLCSHFVAIQFVKGSLATQASVSAICELGAVSAAVVCIGFDKWLGELCMVQAVAMTVSIVPLAIA